MSPSSLASASMIAALVLGPHGALADGGPPKADHPVVAGFERFFAGPGDDARGGRLLLGELNCTSCHKAEGEAASLILAKKAPILDDVGTRARVGHIKALLDGPQAAKPGTTMPDLLGSWPEAKRAEAAEAILHFLASTGRTTEAKIDRRSVGRGRATYRQVGCVACHGAEDDRDDSPVDRLPTTVPLGPIASKYTVASLSAFLLDPHKTRPSGRMPGLGLSPRDARDVANFLLRDLSKGLPASLKYSYYEGEWEKLPDFSTMAPVATGEVLGLDIAVARRGDNFGLRFEGLFRVETAADYQFHLASDDGSILRIDGNVVVDNDEVHPESRKSARVRLGVGSHKVVVDYFNGGGEKSLTLDFDGGGLRTQSVEPFLSIAEEPAKPSAEPAPDRLAVDPALAEKGRSLFASAGCASCHKLENDGEDVASTLSAPPLSALKPGAGCLAPRPAEGLPDYHLNDRQRAAISAALAPISGPAAADPKAAIARTMLAFNCYACHVRDGVGGVEEARNPHFETAQKEIGDEGRIPPHVDGAGGKLNRAYLDHLLADGAKDRPYMKTRMPKFGEENVGHLAGLLASVDAIADAGPAPDFGAPDRKVKAQARFLVGTQAFGCVNCHNFGGEASRGIPALDMTVMTRRLNRDWFVRYVVDPAAYRPGTRMPSAWPKEQEKSQIEGVFDGDPRKQIESVWLYLSDGAGAPKPYGIGREPIPLVAENGEAVIYRNFIEGSGPRSIAVGYPEKANLAFDANALRLALLWQGGFMDASRHWSGRGEGFQPPMGDDILKLPPGPTLAFLEKPDSPWPDAIEKGSSYRFRGYSLSKDGRPTFLYDVGPLHVEDFPDAVAAEGKQSPSLRRVVDFSSPEPVPNCFYRAASGPKIEPIADGWYLIDGEWKTKVESEAKPAIRTSGGKKELVVPVGLAGGKGKVTQVYAW